MQNEVQPADAAALVPPIRDRLLMLKGQQETYRRLCGKKLHRIIWAIIRVWTKSGTSSGLQLCFRSSSRKPLEKKRSLRLSASTTCVTARASLLLANGVPMTQIQNGWGTATSPPPPIFTPTSIRFQVSLHAGDAGRAGLWQCVSIRPKGWAMFRQKNGQTEKIHLSIRFGGASGSRTLAPVSRPIAFRVFEIVDEAGPSRLSLAAEGILATPQKGTSRRNLQAKIGHFFAK